jgi:hypothetical protein
MSFTYKKIKKTKHKGQILVVVNHYLPNSSSFWFVVLIVAVKAKRATKLCCVSDVPG